MKVTGIVAFSGRLLEEIKPLVKKDNYLQGLKVYIAHGLQDNTLPIYYARQAKEYLESLGILIGYHESPIAHQISSDGLQDLNNWIRK